MSAVPSPPAASRAAGPAISDSDFEAIARIASRDYGLHLQASKKPLITSRLARRLRALGLASFAEYSRHIASPEGADEREFMISALTTNVTHFFREGHHFTQLERDLLPALATRARAGGRVRLWSAGCSSGQEAYSIAASLLTVCPDAPRLDMRILATDIDTAVLATAEAGRYPAEEAARLPGARREALFERKPGPDGRLAVRGDVRGLVTFRRLNLIDPWPMAHRFDAIFCRNVTIYFDKPLQERLWSRFAEALAPGGLLFIGHSERVSGPALATLSSAGITAYRQAPRVSGVTSGS